MTYKTYTPPDTIWLQVNHESNITWCEDIVSDMDIKYTISGESEPIYHIDAPKNLWLQVKFIDNVTWNHEIVDDSDAKYIRIDKYQCIIDALETCYEYADTHYHEYGDNKRELDRLGSALEALKYLIKE